MYIYVNKMRRLIFIYLVIIYCLVLVFRYFVSCCIYMVRLDIGFYLEEVIVECDRIYRVVFYRSMGKDDLVFLEIYRRFLCRRY